MAEIIANSPIPGVPTPITVLSQPVLDGVVSTFVVKSTAPPALQTDQWRALIDTEIVLFTAGQNTTSWTGERGVEGSVATAHAAGAAIYHVWTAAGLGAALGTEGALEASQNLADLPNVATARVNLGLGSAATQPSSAFDAAGLSAAETARAQAAEAQLAPLANPAFTGDPTAPTQASSDSSTNLATTAFVQEVTSALSAGLVVHQAVQWATAASLPANAYATGVLTATSDGALSVDGNAVNTNDRIIVQNEAAAANNGIYTVTNKGSGGAAYVLTRATDMNTGAEVPGAYAYVIGGTQNAGAGFTVQGAGPYTIGTTAINWTQFSTTGSFTAGTALVKVGNTVNVVLGTSGSTAAAGNDTRITGALQAANDLLDLASASTARTNLGLGSAATQATAAFDAAGTSAAETTRAEAAEALAAQKSANLSDLASAASARGNLGLGSAAQQSTSAFDAAGTSAAETTRAEAVEAGLAPIASPTLTGTPRAPTVSPGDSSTKIATTAFVQAATDPSGLLGVVWLPDYAADNTGGYWDGAVAAAITQAKTYLQDGQSGYVLITGPGGFYKLGQYGSLAVPSGICFGGFGGGARRSAMFYFPTHANDSASTLQNVAPVTALTTSWNGTGSLVLQNVKDTFPGSGVPLSFPTASTAHPQAAWVGNQLCTYTGVTSNGTATPTLTGVVGITGGAFTGQYGVAAGHAVLIQYGYNLEYTFDKSIEFSGPYTGSLATWCPAGTLNGPVSLPQSSIPLTLSASATLPTAGQFCVVGGAAATFGNAIVTISYTGVTSNGTSSPTLTGCTCSAPVAGTIPTGSSAFLCSEPNAIDGVFMGAHGRVDCYFTGWRYATVAMADHEEWGPHFGATPSSCYTLVRIEGPNTDYAAIDSGNQYFAPGIDWHGAFWAPVSVSAFNYLINPTFYGGNSAGFSAWGFLWKDATYGVTGATGTICTGCIARDMSIEAPGLGIMGCPDGNASADIYFDDCQTGWDGNRSTAPGGACRLSLTLPATLSRSG